MKAKLTYIGPMTERPRYHTNDSSRDVITRDRRTVQVEDARLRTRSPSLTREGFALLPHKSAVSDFRDQEALARTYPHEIEQLIKEASGADRVVISAPGVLRFKDALPEPEPGRLNILPPARFTHIDVSESTVEAITKDWRPTDKAVRRFAHYNVWRTFSPPPQDMPLAICDSCSVSPSDLVDADAVRDAPGKPEWSIVVVMVRYNPNQRWSYFPDMSRDEVLVFKSYDSDPDQPRHVPHSAFKDPSCPQGVAPRASIEMRAIAFWFGD